MTYRLTMSLLALALALAVPACGNSDEDGGQGDGPATATEVRATGPAEEQINAVVAKLQDGLAAADARGICSLMTARGQRLTAAAGGTRHSSCEQATREVIAIFGDDLHESLELVELRVEGPRATAVFRAETGNTYDTRFAQQDGVWLYDSPLGVGAN